VGFASVNGPRIKTGNAGGVERTSCHVDIVDNNVSNQSIVPVGNIAKRTVVVSAGGSTAIDDGALNIEVLDRSKIFRHQPTGTEIADPIVGFRGLVSAAEIARELVNRLPGHGYVNVCSQHEEFSTVILDFSQL